MSRKLCLLVCCAALAAAAPAPRKAFPFEYSQEDLPNGLRLITLPTDYPNIVALQIVVQTGSRNEVEDGKTGFAHLFEHIMFKGTERFPAAKYDGILKKAGAAHNAYTTDDYTCYHITFSREDLDTILMLEADRFQSLRYSEPEFRTEALAVLGEYNKNSSSPFQKMNEALVGTAFTRHTYKHTTMGFLKDIQDMPNQYEYSKLFFDRYYRPEYTTIIVAGDVQAKPVRALVDKYWGAWKRGSYKAAIPAEPAQTEPRQAHVDWPAPTLPILTVAFKSPAYSDTGKDGAALDLFSQLAFSRNSDLYRKLVLQEQKVDVIGGGSPDQVDPGLFQITARIKNPADMDYVRDQILATVRGFQEKPVDAARLDAVKKNLRYAFALRMDNSESIADILARFVALRRTPGNHQQGLRHVRQPHPGRRAGGGAQILHRKRPHDRHPDGQAPGSFPMKRALTLLLLAAPLFAEIRTAALPGKSPLVTLRLVFTTGSASDPADKPGAAYLTAMMLANGGTRELAYKQIVDAMYPMAAGVSAQVDKEMTTFSGETHIDNLDAYYKLFRAMLLDPGWRTDDFTRVKSNAINFLRVALRGNNDEELGKEVLYQTIYAGTPYGHYAAGTVPAIEKMTLDDLKSFYRTHYAQSNLIIGTAGGYPAEFPAAMKKDFAALPPSATPGPRVKNPPAPAANRLVIVDKDTRSVAYSLGYPIDVKRGDPDFPALLVAQSYFGQHRISGGRLYDRMREARGLNYGDYAYIEYFPSGMFRFEPAPNLARQAQIFQIWIRPVETPTAKFALRLGMFELDRLVKEGIPEDAFDRSREFLVKYINLLTKTKNAELGYLIDSMYYGIPEYHQYLRTALAKLTRDDVNRAIRKHLHDDRVVVVAVSKDAEKLKAQLTANDPSPMTYNSPKPDALLAEDKFVELLGLKISPENVTILPVGKVFE